MIHYTQILHIQFDHKKRGSKQLLKKVCKMKRYLINGHLVYPPGGFSTISVEISGKVRWERIEFRLKTLDNIDGTW